MARQSFSDLLATGRDSLTATSANLSATALSAARATQDLVTTTSLDTMAGGSFQSWWRGQGTGPRLVAVTPTLWLADSQWHGNALQLRDAVVERCRTQERPHYLVWNLDGNITARELTHAFGEGRLAHVAWPSPGGVRTPTLDCLLRCCYALHAWLQLRPRQVAVLAGLGGGGHERFLAAAHLRRTMVVESCLEGLEWSHSATIAWEPA